MHCNYFPCNSISIQQSYESIFYFFRTFVYHTGIIVLILYFHILFFFPKCCELFIYSFQVEIYT